MISQPKTSMETVFAIGGIVRVKMDHRVSIAGIKIRMGFVTRPRIPTTMGFAIGKIVRVPRGLRVRRVRQGRIAGITTKMGFATLQKIPITMESVTGGTARGMWDHLV